MAERKRRGDDADAGRLDESLDDDFTDATALADETGSDDGAAETEARPVRRRSATAVKGSAADTAAKPRSKATRAKTPPTKPVKKKDEDRPNVFERMSRFVREVVAELRKVIWPTRKELLTYTAVVVVFVAFVLTIVALLDLGFAKAMLQVFGSGNK